jgi:hypothetical protein
LDAREFVLQGSDEGPGRGQIIDVARGLIGHGDMIREGDRGYKMTRSRDPFIPPASARLRHINARHEQRQIAAAHFDRGAPLLARPGKRALLEPLIQNPESGVIPRQDLQPVPAPIPKQKEMTRKRIERQLLADERREAINRPPQSVAPVAR